MTVVDTPRRSTTWLRLAAVAGVMLGCLSSSIGLTAIQRSISLQSLARAGQLTPTPEQVTELAEGVLPTPALPARPGDAQPAPTAPSRTDSAAVGRELERTRQEARVQEQSASRPRSLPRRAGADDSPPPVVAPVPEPMPPPLAAKTYILFFATGSAAINAEGASVIEEAAHAARQASRVTVTGHDDTAASSDASMALSRQRARAVADMLVSRGVPASIIVIEGRGDLEPLVPIPDDTREPQNRRVTIDFG